MESWAGWVRNNLGHRDPTMQKVGPAFNTLIFFTVTFNTAMLLMTMTIGATLQLGLKEHDLPFGNFIGSLLY